MFIPEDTGRMIIFTEWTEGIAEYGNGVEIGGKMWRAVQSCDDDGKSGLGQFDRRFDFPCLRMRIHKGG